jgi:acyl carrier protein
MEVSSTHVIKGLCDIFPECEEMALSEKTVLGELPEWDSMAAVNLQTYLLQNFQVEVPLELLADETSLQEITAFLSNPVSSQVTW